MNRIRYPFAVDQIEFYLFSFGCTAISCKLSFFFRLLWTQLTIILHRMNISVKTHVKLNAIWLLSSPSTENHVQLSNWRKFKKRLATMLTQRTKQNSTALSTNRTLRASQRNIKHTLPASSFLHFICFDSSMRLWSFAGWFWALMAFIMVEHSNRSAFWRQLTSLVVIEFSGKFIRFHHAIVPNCPLSVCSLSLSVSPFRVVILRQNEYLDCGEWATIILSRLVHHRYIEIRNVMLEQCIYFQFPLGSKCAQLPSINRIKWNDS